MAAAAAATTSADGSEGTRSNTEYEIPAASRPAASAAKPAEFLVAPDPVTKSAERNPSAETRVPAVPVEPAPNSNLVGQKQEKAVISNVIATSRSHLRDGNARLTPLKVPVVG